MPVFTKLGARLLFIHIPKTGGSSVEEFFLGRGWDVSYLDTSSMEDQKDMNYVRKFSPQHQHAKIILERFRIERFDHIFSVVRNPMNRVKSEYFWRNPNIDGSTPNDSDFDAWLKSVESAYRKNFWAMDNHIRPQVDFLFPGVEVIRMESGFSRIIEIESQFSGLPSNSAQEAVREFPHLNKSLLSSRDIVLSKRAENQIRRLYRKDFKQLGY
jgi:hypothetical protein